MTPAPLAPADGLGRGAAFFDLDRTLISGSSAYLFAMAAWRNGMLTTRQVARDSFGALRFRLTGATDDRTAEVRDRILHAVQGSSQADLVALTAVVIPKLLDKIRPEARALLDMHARAGRDTYIVSASPSELVDPLAQALGMTGGIGTVSEVVDGVYTGRLEGPFCYGPGKVEAIAEVVRREGYALPLSYAYSDSASDLPMLEAVGHPVAVNPDGRLEREAHRRGWPVVIFHRQTKRRVRRTSAAVGAAAMAGGGFAAGIQVGRRLGAR